MTKLAASYLFATSGIVAWQATTGILEFIVLVGAALAASAVIWRKLRHAGRALEVIGRLPTWHEQVDAHLAQIDHKLSEGDERMGRIEGKVDGIAHEVNGHEGGIKDRLTKLEKSLAVIADADEHRVKDALAGDSRAPVDRRSTPPA